VQTRKNIKNRNRIGFKTVVLFLFVFLINSTLIAQQGNNWAFGFEAGINFNTEPPSLFQSGSKRYSPPSPTSLSSSISDCNGNLLFYSDGYNVWNKDHQIMSNGTLSNIANLVAQGLILLPFPNDTNKYYLFVSYFKTNPTVPASLESGLYYSVIDKLLDNGKGAVLPALKNIQLNHIPSSNLTLIKHANTIDYWILTSNSKWEGDSIYAYPVNNSGIGVPVKSAALSFNFFKFNPSGDKLVCPGIKITQHPLFAAVMYNFNRQTGVVSTLKPVYTHGKLNYSGRVMVAEFSPNDSFIYFSTDNYHSLNYYINKVIQVETYAVYTPHTDVILFDTIAFYTQRLGALQLAPNNKLYGFISNDTALSTIHNPNVKGISCNFKYRDFKITPALNSSLPPSFYVPVLPASFTWTDNCGDSVDFINTSDSSRFVFFKWYFGDGDSATGFNAKHKYTSPGKYLVRMGAVNDCGAYTWRSDSITVKIRAFPGFTTDSITYSCGVAHVWVRDTSGSLLSGFSKDNLSWIPGHTAQITLDTSGSRTIYQNVSSGECEALTSKQVNVYIEKPPQSNFTIPNPYSCVPAGITFINQSVFDPLILGSSKLIISDKSQNFFDTIISTDDSLLYTHTDTGWYNYMLIVSNSQGCADTLLKSKVVYSAPLPVADFDYSDSNACGEHHYQFINQSTFADFYTWLFDSSFATNLINPVYTYSATGNYTVQLVASNNWCSDTKTVSLQGIVPPHPSAFFMIPSTQECSPYSSLVSNLSQGGILNYNFFTSIGDSSNLTEPTFDFVKGGKYKISLFVTDTLGCIDSTFNEVEIYDVPEAGFEIQQSDTGCSEITFQFKNNSKHNPFNYWFVNGIQKDTSHFFITDFTTSGAYDVKLVTVNSICFDTATLSLNVMLRERPKADFYASETEKCLPASISFTNVSSDADSFLWDTGDFNPFVSGKKILEHQYGKPGVYSVSLIAFSKEGCSDTLQKKNYITIADSLKAAFTTSEPTECDPIKIEFRNQSYFTDSNISFTWDFNDGKFSNAKDPIWFFPYSAKTSYEISLEISNGICSDTTIQTIVLEYLHPIKDSSEIYFVTVDENKVFIYWKKLDAAKEYQIFRSTDGGSWTKLALVDDTFYTDEKANINKQSWLYKIVAIDKCKNISSSGNLGRTVFIEGILTSEENMKLSWNAYESWKNEVNGYSVLRKSKSGSFEEIGYTSSLDFNDAEFYSEDRIDHCYKVIAKEDGGNLHSSYSNEICFHLPVKLWIPNSFSPNNDGINDGFGVIGTNIVSYHIEIFNKWGERIFETNDLKKSWNGKYKGIVVPDGVYIYLVSALGSDGHLITRRGTFLLVK
jgi:gliding motility-associated-like protein